MSLENVEIVRSLFGAWERGNFLTTADWADPEIEWDIADGPTAGSWTGVAGMAASFRGMLGAWEDLRVYAEEYRELDEERVLVLTHNTARGKTSGLEVGQFQTGGACLLHIRGGKVTRLVYYYDR